MLDVSSFSVTGESVPNALAFNTGATYTAAQGGGVARGPETIMFDAPIYAASIRVGQAAGGTVRLTAFDGATPVSTNFQTSQAALQTLDVAAARITSLRHRVQRHGVGVGRPDVEHLAGVGATTRSRPARTRR